MPYIAIRGTIYVPIRFFTEVFGMNNAYFEGKFVHINNENNRVIFKLGGYLKCVTEE